MWEHGLLFDVTELKEAEAAVAYMAYHDGLTGLANRQLFEETLELALKRAKRERSLVAVLYVDLDNFKLVNDSLGHQAGDLLLTGVAERLLASTRDTDLVARQGGDEFLLLLADLDPLGRTRSSGVSSLVSTRRCEHRSSCRVRGSMRGVPWASACTRGTPTTP